MIEHPLITNKEMELPHFYVFLLNTENAAHHVCILNFQKLLIEFPNSKKYSDKTDVFKYRKIGKNQMMFDIKN